MSPGQGEAAALEAAELETLLEAVRPLTVGLEEEVFLVDPESFDLTPCALELLSSLRGDPRFKPELPASQIEIVTPPCASVGEAISVLADGRSTLAAASRGRALELCAGVHPSAAVEGVLNKGARYDHTAAHYGAIARRQLVCALQVHVAVGGAERTRAVYNALRGHLPELAALAANAPFHAGVDTGLASARPKISETLPRQGVPPPIESWKAFVTELSWGADSGLVPEPGMWWWEVRPHPGFGTLELRVPDAQTTVAQAAGVAAAAHCLVAWLSARHDEGEALPCPPSWRIAENRWLACRDGIEGSLVDLHSGERRDTRIVLSDLLDQIEPFALGLRCTGELGQARALVAENGAIRQRAVAARAGLPGLLAWLAGCFREHYPG